MPSKARVSFDDNLKDVKALLTPHERQGGNARGRRYSLEVLNKSAIVLITSYWEAGPGAEYPPASMRNIAGYVTRITPARFSGIGPWALRATG